MCLCSSGKQPLRFSFPISLNMSLNLRPALHLFWGRWTRVTVACGQFQFQTLTKSAYKYISSGNTTKLHPTAFASFFSCYHLVSVLVQGFEQYTTGLHHFTNGSYYFMLAAMPNGPVSLTLVCHRGSKNHSDSSYKHCFHFHFWNSRIHWNSTTFLSRLLGCAMNCAKPFMKSVFAQVKNKNDGTSACDSGGPVACSSANLMRSGEISSVENTLPKKFYPGLNWLFLILRVNPCVYQGCCFCLRPDHAFLVMLQRSRGHYRCR